MVSHTDIPILYAEQFSSLDFTTSISSIYTYVFTFQTTSNKTQSRPLSRNTLNSSTSTSLCGAAQPKP